MTDSINSHNNNKMSENDRSKTNSTDSHIDSKGGENDGFETTIPEDSRAVLTGSSQTKRTRFMRMRLLLNILKIKLSQTIKKYE